MKKVVFFTDIGRINNAFDFFDLSSFAGKEVPVKLHMGEVKNKYYPKSDFVKIVVQELIRRGVKPFLHDTTVAYNSQRKSKLGYEKVASLHGFTKSKVGCNVKIDDVGVIVNVKDRDFEVAKNLFNSSFVFGLTHVKGHVATGMGGAIKNFGMGGVTRETKIKMHNGSRPLFQIDSCTFCGSCAEVCPFNALKVNGNSWKNDVESCAGCGVCVGVCPNGALTYQDADLQYVLACAAKACLFDKNAVFLNEVMNISRSCDCDPNSGPIICPDIGYLLSDDPVAIDKASLDLVNDAKKDVFEKTHHVNPLKQIEYAEKIGLGSSKYKIVEL